MTVRMPWYPGSFDREKCNLAEEAVVNPVRVEIENLSSGEVEVSFIDEEQNGKVCIRTNVSGIFALERAIANWKEGMKDEAKRALALVISKAEEAGVDVRTFLSDLEVKRNKDNPEVEKAQKAAAEIQKVRDLSSVMRGIRKDGASSLDDF